MSHFDCARCDWRPDRDAVDEQGAAVPARQQLLEHAAGAAHPVCPGCERSLTQHDPVFGCEGCLSAAQAFLSGIVTLYAELPAYRARTSGGLVRGGGGSDGPPFPGGDILVLLAGGSPGYDDDGLTSRDTDPTSVAYDLGWWANRWMSERDELVPLGSRPGRVVLNASGYLERRARWAANNHSGFAQYLADMEALHARLQRATGHALRHARANASCFDCGGQLVKLDDPEDGLSDLVSCRQCGQQYTKVKYNLALKAAVFDACQADVDGLKFATPTIVAAAVGRPERTIREWERRQLVRRHVLAGVVLVCLQDAQREHDQRLSRKRIRQAAV